MHKIFKHKYTTFICMALTALLLGSCDGICEPDSNHKNSTFIVFSLGFNNLSSALKSDMEDLVTYSLSKNHTQDNLLVFSHHTTSGSNYSNSTSPVLTHIYKNKKDQIVRDTLLVMDPGTKSASSETIRTVLEFVQENFPSDKYGMLLSSHGTGWAPENYCNYPDNFDKVSNGTIWRSSTQDRVIPAPLMDGAPDVKSFGVQNASKSEIIEIDINDLAEAMPMKVDYIIFDACFMGGVEVAYEFMDKCDKMVFSQTEILADGMDYKTMLSYLFGKSEPDLKGLCENFFNYYDTQRDIYRSATISLIDCQKLPSLAQACKAIFEAQSPYLSNLDRSQVQRYFRASYYDIHGWFYDLGSIISNCQTTEEQVTGFEEALSSCVIYKASTEWFMSDIQIKTHSGLSMYLPYENRTYLNEFYKTLRWNADTELIK